MISGVKPIWQNQMEEQRTVLGMLYPRGGWEVGLVGSDWVFTV